MTVSVNYWFRRASSVLSALNPLNQLVKYSLIRMTINDYLPGGKSLSPFFRDFGDSFPLPTASRKTKIVEYSLAITDSLPRLIS